MANRVKGITIDINGRVTGLDRSLQTINARLKTTQTDLRDVQRLMQFSGGVQGLKLWGQQQTVLKDQIGATREKLQQLKTASEQAAKTRKNYSQWAAAIKPVEEELTKVQTNIKTTEQKMKVLKNAGKVDTSQYKDLQKRMQDLQNESKRLTQRKKEIDREFGKPLSPEQWDRLQREIIETENNLKRLQRMASPIRQAFKSIGDAGQKVYTGLDKGASKMKSAGDRIKKIAGEINRTTQGIATGAASAISSAANTAGQTLTRGAVALDTALGAAVKTTGGFDTTMSAVKAISGATEEEFQALRDTAREMGKSTKFSAQESADGLRYMAMAGWTAQEAIAALPHVLNLAVAGGADLATTSDIVTDAMTALGMAADKSGHFADVLAATAANSNTSIEIMGETFKDSAAIAGALGYSVEDVSLAIGMMANAGIKGTRAGTALKNTLNGLVNGATLTAKAFGEGGIEFSSVKNDGTLKSYRETMGELRSLFSQMTEAERVINAQNIAGAYGKNGLLAILNSTAEDYTELQSKIDNCSGAAQKMAEIMGDNLTGDTLRLKSAVAELGIQYGDILMPKIRDTVQSLTGLVEKFQETDEETKKKILNIAGIATVAGPALLLIGSLTGGIGTLIGSIGNLGVGSIGAIAGIGGIAYALKQLYDNNEQVRDLVDQYIPQIGTAFDSVGQVAKQKLGEMGIDVDGFVAKFRDIKDRALEGFSDIWPDIKENASLVFDTIKDTLPIVFDVLKEDILPIGKKVLQWFNNLDPKTKRLLVKIGTFALVFGPLLSVFGSVLSIGGSVIGLVGGGIKIVGLLGGALSTLISPAGLVVAAIAGIGFAVYEIVKHWDDIKEFFAKVKDKIVGTVTDVIDWIADLPQRALEFGKTIIKKLIDGILSKMAALKEKIMSIGTLVKESLGLGIDENKNTAENARHLSRGWGEPLLASGPTYNNNNAQTKTTNNYNENYGGVSVVINAAGGQSADDIYNELNRRLGQAAQRKKNGRGR